MTNDYRSQKNAENKIKIKNMLKNLPEFVSEWDRSIAHSKETSTRLGYLTDVKQFMEWLSSKNSTISSTMAITLDILDSLTVDDFNEYIEDAGVFYRYSHKTGKKEIHNTSKASLKRKLAAIRSLYHYLIQSEKIVHNRVIYVELPKTTRKTIIRMEPEETAEFLDNVEYGTHLTHAAQKKHEKYARRDLAILTLLLGTGIRVSECVGINLSDIDYNQDRIHIIRKGANEDYVYFGDEVRDSLYDYIEKERKYQNAKEGHENALFLSNRNSRITVRSIQILVKKYSNNVVYGKKLSPHSMRKTYGTELYNETHDIYAVSRALAHKDIKTTQAHYVEKKDNRDIRNTVKLREKSNP